MDEVWKQILKILADVKASAHELHSPRLEYLDIATVMRCFCKELGERKEVEIDFRGHGRPGLMPPDILYLPLPGTAGSVVQRGAAQRGAAVRCSIVGNQNEVHLAVRDSGVGFDVVAARTGTGLGLIRMEQRLKLVKGTFLDRIATP